MLRRECLKQYSDPYKSYQIRKDKNQIQYQDNQNQK